MSARSGQQSGGYGIERNKRISVYNLTEDLQDFLSQLSNKELFRAMRNAMLVEARRLRRIAVGRLKASTLHHAAKVGTKVRAGASRDCSRLFVKVNTRGTKSRYTPTPYSYKRASKGGAVRTRQPLPIPLWAEVGTPNARGGGMGARKKGSGNIRFLERTKQTEFRETERNLIKGLEVQARKLLLKRIKRNYGI